MSRPKRVGTFGRLEGYLNLSSSSNTFYNVYGPGSDFNRRVSLDSEGKNVLQVQTVDLLVKYNAKAHHTLAYHITKSKEGAKLVVRRGQPFTIGVTFSKKYDEKTDELLLVFEAGYSPLPSKGTSIELVLSHEDKKNEWGAKIESQKDNTLMVTVFTPPNLYVGQWNLKIDVVKKEDTKIIIHRYLHNDPVYIIFNPWCKEDDVYMEGDALIAEYVMNQRGRIFNGTETNMTFRAWNFGQFESCVLDVAMSLLDRTMGWSARGKPVLVIRKVSALVNSNDEDGVVVGSWDETFPNGHNPTEWTGSARILEKYWEGKKPICYGQCWVFSGLCTTLSRTLGIPARCVTCYQCAHDSDGSLCVDHYMVNDAWKKADHIWNFHVWNEAWMSRPDLPHGYGGWQAFDATPQELSDGTYCCGPASVRAVKEGKINLPYDTPFVFSEVNADKVFWYQNEDGHWVCLEVIKDAIGLLISTKAIGSNEREDVTDQYKPKEESFVERITVNSAYITGKKQNLRNENPKGVKDITFTVSEAKKNNLGEDFELLLTMKNTSDQHRTVNGHVEINTTYYTGVVAGLVKTENIVKVIAPPGEERKYSLVVPHSDYVEKLKEFGMLDVSMWAFVEETEQSFIHNSSYRLHRPHLSIQAPTKTKMGEEMNIDVSFENPLNVHLTKSFLLVDGVCPSIKFFQGNVQPKGTFTATVSVTPNVVGVSELIVNFNSAELKDINATFEIEII